jgi:hypothetical protein
MRLKTTMVFSMPDASRGTDIIIAPERLLELASHFDTGLGTTDQKLAAFSRFVDRTDLSRFLVRYELFKLITSVQGSIVECGVYDGAGLFALNHRRRVVGFDTFGGFPSVSEIDTVGGSSRLHPGGYQGASRDELARSIRYYDNGRPLNHIDKIELVEGDFLEVGQRYVKDNPHLIVALLYLDFDLFEPTCEALELFLPLMPAGSVLAFDEVNVAEAPGETQALLQKVGVRRLRLQRTAATSISWAVLDDNH